LKTLRRKHTWFGRASPADNAYIAAQIFLDGREDSTEAFEQARAQKRLEHERNRIHVLDMDSFYKPRQSISIIEDTPQYYVWEMTFSQLVNYQRVGFGDTQTEMLFRGHHLVVNVHIDSVEGEADEWRRGFGEGWIREMLRANGLLAIK
jgi:hypothetical protein